MRVLPYRFACSTVVAIALCGTGCRSIAEPPRAPTAAAATIEVIGRDGRERERAVHAVAAGDELKPLLQHHLQVMAQRQGPPLIASNEVKLLIDGPQTYDAVFGALDAAQRSIDVEVYIFDDDKLGRSLAAMLKRESRSGVRVRVIYDSVGCIRTPKNFFEDMRAAGVQIVEFNPVNPLAGKLLKLNHRDHRKIFIVDGDVAFTGGINVSSVYAHGSGVSRKDDAEADADSALSRGWRDTQIQVTGPAVREFARLFEATWAQSGGGVSTEPVAESRAPGDKYVRVIGSTPDDEVNHIYADLLTAIEHSRHSVHITMSYFSPNRKMIEALAAAARRGVDVQLVLPGFSDWWPVLEAGRSHYRELLEAGVFIFERRDVFLHAKTAVIDGVWSTVGSSNMDMRSFLHNNEVNAVVLGNDFANAMESMFAQDRAKAERVELNVWNERSLLLRVKQTLSRMFGYWL